MSFAQRSERRGGSKPSFMRRPKQCPFTGDKAPVLDYKDTELLKRYISEKGKIMPSRLTGVCAKKQRELTTAIKRARMLALIPFTDHKE